VPIPTTFRIISRGFFTLAIVIVSLGVISGDATPPSLPETTQQTLREHLKRNDIRGAIQTAAKTPDPGKAYEYIATHQVDVRDFDGARKTIRHITVGSVRLPQAGLIPHSSALTTLARGLFKAGRKPEARTALRAAMADADRIPGIFAEMGEGFGPMAGERWIYIAETQLLWGDRGGASKSLDKAESFAAGSHLGYDASDALTRIETGRKALGQTKAAARARRELKFASANSITDIAVKAEALVDIDAQDGNAAGVLETVKQQGNAENPVELLCHGVMTINRIHGDQKCRERLLAEARKLSNRTKDSKFKKMEQEMIVKAEAGATD